MSATLRGGARCQTTDASDLQIKLLHHTVVCKYGTKCDLVIRFKLCICLL